MPQSGKRRRWLRCLGIAMLMLAPWVCASESDAPSADYAVQANPLQPIVVGPRDGVGKPTAGQKVVGGLLGSVFGGRGGQSDQPRVRRDPTRRQDYAPFRSPGGDLETGARAAWAEEGLLVSTRIDEADDKGTFQTVFLQTCDGRRLYPRRYEIYKLWGKGSVTVSWSKTTTVDGQVVGHETGGWSDTWTEGFDAFAAGSGEELPPMPATWQQLGFDRATGGARQIGAHFNVSPESLPELGDVALFTHTTVPAADPVSTVPSYWVLRAGEGGDPRVAGQGDPARAAKAWEEWSERCAVVSPVLIAAAGAAPLATALTGADAAAAARSGYPLPENVSVSTPVSTGRTTGHIADITVRNDGTKPIVFPVGPFYIPSEGRFQGYVGRPGGGTPIPPGATRSVPVEGYCGDVRRAPVPAGDPLPPVEDWIVPGDPDRPVSIPPREGAGDPGRALVPGTDEAVPRAVDPDVEPEIAAPLLFGAIREIERAAAELQESGELQTPFSGNPEREREAVVQQTIWIFAGELEGEPYTREEFTERLEEQYEERSGTPITAAPPEEREKLDQGADDFWDAFELVGAEAKVISAPESTPEKPAETAPPPEEIAAGCTLAQTIEHTPKRVDVEIADTYGNEEDRKKIHDGIKKAVEEADEAYATTTPPSTAYAIWGHDHVGGISSAYAKTIFLKDQGQEWVWWTDPLDTTSTGTGTHTLAFTHGAECTSVVGGSALMWMKAQSEAFDPLERHIEVFRALDAVKDVSVKYLAGKLPPGVGDALETSVDAITDPASDTYAAATGTATLTVGADTDRDTAANRVVYKREDKEDSAIVGGGETIKKLSATDAKPGSLTSRLDAESELEAGAQGNGFAKAYLESLYGTILIGVCECPEGMTYKILTDTGQFIRSEGVRESVVRAMREMDEAADRIAEDLESGKLQPTGDALKERAEQELEDWGESIGGERFEPEPEGEAGD